MKKIIKSYKLLVVVHMMILLFSCNSTKSVSNCINEPTAVFKYGMTYFQTSEYTTLLSLHKIQKDTMLASLDSGYCFINGRVLVRDGLDCYSGELYDRFKYQEGWARVIIPELGIDKTIEDGYFRERIPCGTYDVIMIANHFEPIHILKTFKEKHFYSIDFYLGYTINNSSTFGSSSL